MQVWVLEKSRIDGDTTWVIISAVYKELEAAMDAALALEGRTSLNDPITTGWTVAITSAEYYE